MSVKTCALTFSCSDVNDNAIFIEVKNKDWALKATRGHVYLTETYWKNLLTMLTI